MQGTGGSGALWWYASQALNLQGNAMHKCQVSCELGGGNGLQG